MARRVHQVYLWFSVVALVLTFAISPIGEGIVDSGAPAYFSNVVITCERPHVPAMITAFDNARASIDPGAKLSMLGSKEPEQNENRLIDFDLVVYGANSKAALERTQTFVDHMNAELKHREISELLVRPLARPLSVYPPWGKLLLTICSKLSWAFGLLSAFLFFLACRQQARSDPPALPKEKEEAGFDY